MPIATNVCLGEGVRIVHPELVNLYGCAVGEETMIGPFVEVQSDARVGARCKVSSHSFICAGVTIEDEVFVGHGVMFINDLHPRAVGAHGGLQTAADWTLVETRVRRGASIGSNATIMGGVTIGEQALVGAGAVVTRDVPSYAIAVGVPARVVGDVRDRRGLPLETAISGRQLATGQVARPASAEANRALQYREQSQGNIECDGDQEGSHPDGEWAAPLDAVALGRGDGDLFADEQGNQ
jgi:UDP-2-acetamido-3-amino-2,3-dideoxy-glucuronate N-acetyltransferase